MSTTALATLTNNLAARFDIDESNSKELIDTLKATAFKIKDGVVTDTQMTALLIVSQQYGLNPWTKEIYAYPDKQNGIVPVVSVDGWSRIINDNDLLDGIEFRYSDETTTHKNKLVHEWIECIITRKDRSKPIVIREYFDEVCRILNFATPWDTHPKRMHRHKALIQCARVAFGFGGIYDQDEAERIVEIDTQTGEITKRTQEAKNTEKVIEGKTVLPAYPDEKFKENQDKWYESIVSGKKTSDQIISTLRTRFSLTEDQENQIILWGAK